MTLIVVKLFRTPKKGKIYTCKLCTEGTDKLKVHGYIGPFYFTQTWNRIQSKIKYK
ncbi:DUF2147 domain-containing protein [Polaribacter sp.]|uniref:DUF2147 domain-containing protein n=1 Tax=Polaribacter sp. TaxID=1920175 RepID=UPI003F4C69D1